MVAAVVVLASSCGSAGGGSPLALDDVTRLRPLEAGTYRMTGTERDSRTDQPFELVETYRVEPAFERDGNEHQVTNFDDQNNRFRSSWETSLRAAGAFRIRESAGDESWSWDPPLQTSALPMREGVRWESKSSAVVPDMNGERRESTITVKGAVAEATTVVVTGKVLPVFVIETTVTTNVLDTERATGEVSRRTTVRTSRSWFSPEHMQTVKTFSKTEVKGDDDEGYSDYVLTRSVVAESLGPVRAVHP